MQRLSVGFLKKKKKTLNFHPENNVKMTSKFKKDLLETYSLKKKNLVYFSLATKIANFKALLSKYFKRKYV